MAHWTNQLTKPLTWIGVGAVIVGGAVWAQTRQGAGLSLERPPIELTPARTATMLGSGASGTAEAMEAAFVSLAENAGKAVVHITSDTTGLNGATGQRPTMGGEGSGFVYRSDGWIVTNEHVVQGKSQVRVVLADGREMLGKVTPAKDSQLDLAVIKVDAAGLPTLPLSREKQVQPGQYAIAIGAPFGLENSVTIGHVSAISRRSQINDPFTGTMRGYSGMIQTDASINPGNSGGPLLNLRGEVIGVNTSIYSTTGGNNGIGFAIPARVVREVADELIEKGSFDRGLLGLVPRDLKPFEREAKGVRSGALVAEVPPESAAFKAGLREGDVVVKVSDFDITDELDLRISAYRHSPGETVKVEYVRDKSRRTAQVTLGKATDLDAQQPQPDFRRRVPSIDEFFRAPFGQEDGGVPQAPRAGKPRLGVSLQSLDPTLRTQFKLPAESVGVVVVAVEPGSFADRLNIKAGDVVTEIDGKKVTTVQDVTEAMKDKAWGDQVSLGFERYSEGSKSTFRTIVPFR